MKTDPPPPYPTRYSREVDARCPRGFLTREMVQAKTGLTDSQLRSYTRQKRLRSAGKNSRGLVLYEKSEVDRFVRELRGQLVSNANAVAPKKLVSFQSATITPIMYSEKEAAMVADLRHQELSLAEIQRQTKLHPSIVATIASDLAALEGSVLVSRETMKLINKLPLQGTFPLSSGEEIYEVMRRAAKHAACRACDRDVAEICKACFRRKLREKLAATTSATPGGVLEHARESSGERPSVEAPAVVAEEVPVPDGTARLA